MCQSFEEFSRLYSALTGHDHGCRWQYRLFCDLRDGKIPSTIELPTGIGKTSIAALWVLALAQALRTLRCALPRRLAFIVDRRVVVDQATDFAEEIRTRLEGAHSRQDDPLFHVAATLHDAGGSDGVLKTSTLRGQRALDTDWRNDPSRPAIIVGTVDMIGSRLLFSAYGRVGPWGRALEAGLLGQDCLVVLDEAHLSSPFAATLAAVEEHNGALAPFSVIRMGATMAPVEELLRRTPGLDDQPGATKRAPFRLRRDEKREDIVRSRLSAIKQIEVVETEGSVGEFLADWAVGQSEREPGTAIGIVLNTVAEARQCAEHLERELKAQGKRDLVDLTTITGSMRGWDRDQMLAQPAFNRFQSRRDRSMQTDRPAILVATSAIEVGADIDCDHMGTEPCAIDSLIQRLGRVNRLGKRGNAGSKILIAGRPKKETAEERVFQRLRQLSALRCLDGSAMRLTWRLTRLGTANTGLHEIRVPPPALTTAVLDDLAMTSKYPETRCRPDVARWLHGSVEDAALYVEIAWRAELDLVAESSRATCLIEAFPVSASETARCPWYEAVAVLNAIRKRAEKNPLLGARPIVCIRDGELMAHPIASLPADEDELRKLVLDSVLVLPASAGGYDGCFVNPGASQGVLDVAEQAQPSHRPQRRRLWLTSGLVPSTGQVTGGVQIDDEVAEDELMDECADAVTALLGASWRPIAATGDGRVGIIVARQSKDAAEEAEEDDASVSFARPVFLDDHQNQTHEIAKRLACLVPEDAAARAVMIAAGNHDLGKNRSWWQRAVGRSSGPPVAKSQYPWFNHRINRGYRHELGSVVDVRKTGSLLDGIDADLCVHLIATHHGHGRPGFRIAAVGPLPTPELKHVIEESPFRFARLQSAYGYWGLAWLESLVKTADLMASEQRKKR